MNYLSEKELLKLKATINGEIAVSIYDLTLSHIPDLVDEILELRKQIKYSQKLQNLREIYEQ